MVACEPPWDLKQSEKDKKPISPCNYAEADEGESWYVPGIRWIAKERTSCPGFGSYSYHLVLFPEIWAMDTAAHQASERAIGVQPPRPTVWNGLLSHSHDENRISMLSTQLL